MFGWVRSLVIRTVLAVLIILFACGCAHQHLSTPQPSLLTPSSSITLSAAQLPAGPGDTTVVVLEGDSTQYILFRPLEVIPGFWWEAAYAWVEKRTGRTGQFSEVEWAVADSMKERHPDGTTDDLAGLWLLNHGRRIIVYAREWVNLPEIVVHEMCHDVLPPDVGHGPEHQRCLPSYRP